ncbi:uncharacterized protein VTP21DRAFT_4400 [Calcarisporiella thermophila]|uniref:uncharacterized protein n=1 Tax=Calcarisporiella thermophila TaxID=911321 RepID=UPI0037443C69
MDQIPRAVYLQFIIEKKKLETEIKALHMDLARLQQQERQLKAARSVQAITGSPNCTENIAPLVMSRVVTH